MKYLRELVATNFNMMIVVFGSLYIMQQLHVSGIAATALVLVVVGVVFDWASDEIA